MSTDLEPLPDLVRRVDLAGLVARYAGNGRQTGRTTSYLCPSPDHPDRHPSFTVTDGPTGQRWRCWSQCARGGDALDLVAWLEGLDLGEAAVWLRRYLGDPDTAGPARSRPTGPSKAKRERAPLPTTSRPPEEAAGRLLAGYLADRGWPPHTAELYGLEVVLAARGRPAVRHPFYAVTGSTEVELDSWQDRLLHHDPERDGGKWHAAPGRPLRLWNLPGLEAEELTAVVIAEGPADGITADLALHHRPEVAAVAVAGSEGWRSSWAPMLTGLQVVIATDADTAGDNLAEKIAADLDSLAEVARACLPDGVNDLTELGRTAGLQAVTELLEQYLPAPPPPAPRGTREEPTSTTEAPAVIAWEELDLFGAWETEETTPAAIGDLCPACGPTGSTGELCSTCATAETSGPHRWRACSECGRLALAAHGRHCILTPACAGRYQPRQPREAAA